MKTKQLTMWKVARELAYQLLVFLAFYQLSERLQGLIVWSLWIVAVLMIMGIIAASKYPEKIKERWSVAFLRFEFWSSVALCSQLVYWGEMVLGTVLLICHLATYAIMSQARDK